MADERFVLLDAEWVPDEMVQKRNLGCPYYDDCLDAANAMLIKLSGRSARSKKSWKLELRTSTWACRDDCPHRRVRRTFSIELIRSPQNPDGTS